MTWSPLLNPPEFPAAEYNRLGSRLGAVLETANDVVVVPGEAIVALEAVATDLGTPGYPVLNVVTSPYGKLFGQWLASSGSPVLNLSSTPGLPVTIADIEEAVDRFSPRAIAIVHGEAASGIVNPLAEIAGFARSRGLLTIVDAVASVGAEPLPVDDWGLDIVVIGPQKALLGPAGISAVAVSQTGWAALAANAAPRADLSSVSLVDIKRDWLDSDRSVIPGTPAPLELWALDAALARFEAIGLRESINAHQTAKRAVRAMVRSLGLELWAADNDASALTTTVVVPAGIDPGDLARTAHGSFGALVSTGVGPGAERLVRVNHTALAAAFGPAAANVVGLLAALRRHGFTGPDHGALDAVVAAYAAAP